MRDILPHLKHWWDSGETAALATVVETFHSAPRPAGASMLVGPEGEVVGSVSGGCVEGDVYEVAQMVRGTGSARLEHYGISSQDAFSVGLTCGGMLDVFVERISQSDFPELSDALADIASGAPVAIATVIEHPDPQRVGSKLILRPENKQAGTLGTAQIDETVTADAIDLLAVGRSTTLEYGPEGQRLGNGMRVFVSSFAPPPRMLVFGAIDFAKAVAHIGKFLGYQVTVCDARPIFATPARFPEADQVIVRWPDEYLREETVNGRTDDRTVVCVLTHDPKFDVPVLKVALEEQNFAYVGAMGSRKTHDDRLLRLQEAGIPAKRLARLSSPIGLDLGGRTPEETAVSIAAEIIALRQGGSGKRLTDLSGPVHRSETEHKPLITME